MSFPKNPHRRTYLHLYYSLHSTHRVDGSAGQAKRVTYTAVSRNKYGTGYKMMG